MRRSSGFSLVEMLVALAVFGVLTATVSGFFASQAEHTRRTQARSEVQDRVRLAMQLVSQDLQLAGASRYVSGSTVHEVAGFASCSVTPCLEVRTPTPGEPIIEGRYVTTLRPIASACREVAYLYTTSTGTVQRSDVGCGAAESFVLVGEDLPVVGLVFVCGNGQRTTDPASCAAAGSFTRSARVTIVGVSNETVPRLTQNRTYTVTAADGTTSTFRCPDGRACFGLEQEVLMPNLKDK